MRTVASKEKDIPIKRELPVKQPPKIPPAKETTEAPVKVPPLIPPKKVEVKG